MDKFELQNWLEELLKAGELDRAIQIARMGHDFEKFLSVLPDLRQLDCDDF